MGKHARETFAFIAREICSMIERFDLSTVAAAAGVSHSTIASVRDTGQLPDRSDPRVRLIRCADINRGVDRRGDLKFVD